MVAANWGSYVILPLWMISGAAAAPTYGTDAAQAFEALQSWYNASSGLWDTTGWWNSANCLTVLGNLAATESDLQPYISTILANSFAQAPQFNLQMTKVVQADFNIASLYGADVAVRSTVKTLAINPKGFLNGFYDDEGWWALGWIQAYDVTQNQDYLSTAASIFEDMKNGSTTPCGGIWWDKAETYVNAIANELYLSVASHLSNRMSDRQYYLDTALTQWDFLKNSGMLNSNNLFNDGLDTSCRNNNGTVWSYNQGVVLGALVELNIAAPNTEYITAAKNIAHASITALGDTTGVLHDVCEPNCGGDGNQFKGILMRNLQKLQTAAPDSVVLEFIATNAASIWSKARDSQNQLGLVWSGPVGGADAATQSSAMDALIAGAAFGDLLQNAIIS
ncbi:glycosyl hydrolase [Phlyctema vagabunda]|uniref:Glycosyl hydrolase n=1 Tax=Phlyctema vagabunda TaxID=108571 RepID=A0ABR4PH69_9HELO